MLRVHKSRRLKKPARLNDVCEAVTLLIVKQNQVDEIFTSRNS